VLVRHLLTIANAFHRLDRPLLAEKGKAWLRPGGCFVVMGYGDPPNAPRPKARWQEVRAEVVEKWTGPPSEAVGRAMSGPLHGELLASAGYETEQLEWTMPRRWTLDELVGLTFSISTSSRRQLGERADAFEADFRASLLNVDPSGEYAEELRFFAILATRS
jgi:hypothetical protein